MPTRHAAVIHVNDPHRAAALGERLRSQELDAFVASSSDQLHETLSSQLISVLIVENELRGFLTGLDILTRVYEELVHPATILLSTGGAETRERARALGVERVMPTQVDIGDIVAAAAALIAESAIAQLPIHPVARKLARAVADLEPMPQVLIRLSDYIGETSDDVEVGQLAEEISLDPRVTADLLKIANSPSVGLRRSVENVLEAVTYLGIRRTVSLVLSRHIMRVKQRMSQRMPPAERQWYQERSVLIAATAAGFARTFESISADTAYVLGLLQDTGILILANVHGHRYLKLLRRFREVGALRLEVVEKQDYQVTHADVSAAALQVWGLPQSMTRLVLTHLDEEITASSTEVRFHRLMRIGEAFANLADGHVPQRVPLLNRALRAYGGMRSDRSKTALTYAVAKVNEARELFALPTPDADRMQDLVGRASEVVPNEAAAVVAPPASEEDIPASPTPATRRVLLLDDEAAVREIVEAFLRDDVVELTAVATIEEAWPYVAESDGILVDVHLATRDGHAQSGLEFVEGLREANYDGPVLVLTGDRTRETVGKSVLLGVVDYILKPFDRKTLRAKLSKHGLLASQVTPGHQGLAENAGH